MAVVTKRSFGDERQAGIRPMFGANFRWVLDEVVTVGKPCPVAAIEVGLSRLALGKQVSCLSSSMCQYSALS